MKQVAIVGGGLAGLISGALLAKKGVPVTLFERKNFPVHKVCGEYVSNETVSFLKTHDLYPEKFRPSQVSMLQLTSVRGQSATLPLNMGGFGISRYNFDNFLAEKASQAGVKLCLNEEVVDVRLNNGSFQITTGNGYYESDVVIGAFGKRSKLDVAMKRKFLTTRSPYVGVKYHAKTNHPDGIISLHNFDGGYCGVVNIEDDITNICYLVSRQNVQLAGNIHELETQFLKQNRFIADLLNQAQYLSEKPYVINEISFDSKELIVGGILMAGDAAGMITPLCGNGMAIAIRSAHLLSSSVYDFAKGNCSRNEMERTYASSWRKEFSFRLKVGRTVQRLFGNAGLSELAIRLMKNSSIASQFVIRQTHGNPF